MPKINVFISYSHADKRFKDELLKHFRTLEREGKVSFWQESDIEAGAEWNDTIRRAIDEADIAILLISPSFLASDYIRELELPALIDRANRRGTIISPILVQPTLWTTVPELAQYQFLNDVTKPLSTVENREEELSRVAQRLQQLITAISSRGEARSPQTEHPSTQPPVGAPPADERLVFLSHSKVDGDFAELLKYRLEQSGFHAWIDMDRLAPGVDWRQEIDDSIRRCLALIAIMSPDARNSEYVTYEWAFAWGTNKRIIPIMLRETPLHPRLATLQYLDFTNRNARPWPRLFDALSLVANS